MGVKDKKLLLWGFTKKSDFYGGAHEKINIQDGDCLKRGQFAEP